MRELFRLPILSIICILAVVGCNNLRSSKVNAKIDGDVLVIDADSTMIHTIQISIDEITFSTSVRGRKEFNLMDSLKFHSAIHYELAYALTENNGLMDVHLTIPNQLDTTLQWQFKYNEIWEHNGHLTSGKFAKIVNTFDTENIDSELRRWVYRNKKVNIGDTLFNDMRLYLRELSTTTSTKYVVQGTIPSIKEADLKGYAAAADMIADNYYLFVCCNDSELDLFIEEMVSKNFPDASKTINGQLSTYRMIGNSGTKCIFLVGINNDWTSQIFPLGVVSIDNVAPSYGMYSDTYDDSYTTLNFPKRGFTIDVTGHPLVGGKWDVDYGDFQGWSTYNVPYTLTWKGDVSKIVIYKSKSNPYTINLKGKTSPYHIVVPTYLPNTGDNYVKLEAYDSIGNKSEKEINIALERVKDNETVIDIDNNIWN